MLDYETAKYDAMLQSHGGKAKAVALSIEDPGTDAVSYYIQFR